MNETSNKIISNIKSLGIDMIENAGSGHPGIVLGAAPIMYTLYAKHINANPSDPNWINRDRFVLSAGHGSALLYATLFMAGYNITIEDLKNFRHINSKTPGHPEINVTPGVDVSTGPLGQGIATSVGLALAEKMLEERANINGKKLINHKTYVLCGDGDLMEGISYEAMSLAGSLKLNNLIVLYDSNNISLDGSTSTTFNENIELRAKGLNWDYELVKDGTNIPAIDKAIARAKENKRPTIIEVKSTIGKGSYLEGTNAVHGKPLEKEDVAQLKYNLNIPQTPFYVDNDCRTEFRKEFATRSGVAYSKWAKTYQEIYNSGYDLKNIAYIFNSKTTCNFLNYDFKLEGKTEATRVTNKHIMNEIAKYIPFLIGGSADVASTTNAYLDNMGDIMPDNYNGRNIRFGVREHAMGAISNGLALSNFRVFSSAFLCFSDYLKPAIRMSALMKLPNIYIFTHDSILVGQDGPTHQPVEQLAMLRSIPNLNVFRPCDANELIGTWNTILNSNETPSAIILSRTEVPQISTSKKEEVINGAYIIKDSENYDAIIIASGTEVSTAISLKEVLEKQNNIKLRIVSIPCKELFDQTSIEYKESIIPNNKIKFVLEASISFGWEKYATSTEYIIGINTFGVSGTKDEVLKQMNFDFETIKEKIIKLITKG